MPSHIASRDGTLLAPANLLVSVELTADRSRPAVKTHRDDPKIGTESGLAAASALHGRIDYADLAERVVQGVTVRMANRRRLKPRRSRSQS